MEKPKRVLVSMETEKLLLKQNLQKPIQLLKLKAKQNLQILKSETEFWIPLQGVKQKNQKKVVQNQKPIKRFVKIKEVS
jgi:hypothetical protein